MQGGSLVTGLVRDKNKGFMGGDYEYPGGKKPVVFFVIVKNKFFTDVFGKRNLRIDTSEMGSSAILGF